MAGKREEGVIICLAIDLGVVLHIAVVTGTSTNPVLLELAKIEWRGPEHTAAVEDLIEEIIARRGVTVMSFEETFSAGTKRKGWLRDVGRAQEHQAGYLEGCFGRRVNVARVPPVTAPEALVAWHQFGRPEWAAGRKGEHYRDALGVALKAMVRIEDRKRDGAAMAAGRERP